ncbi:phosphate signaling complex protein PhoU [Candidatus Methanosphaera massiliense]|jgi:phosphate transport system protein|uniref:phosphate signaling complex protein PhoU n=1 Tax=Methanosphaera TaxID=2316 RepID=UPI0023801D88|nr:phosphate signaling complex protein PhoU [Candidatus Methanosphaera massiliense]MDD6285845.1 phosphate signaling complex protein PhoU [Methanobacteriaceae archaeon]MDE4078299.1 phosphate signaling complex protein PhoU [Candidatus Methanosphaera massiliense]MDY2744016.1 phosphate signaling complex protein PhoU [Methanosphaera sp.]
MPEYRRKFRKQIRRLEDSIEELSNLTISNYEGAIDLFNNYSDEKYQKIEENTKEITEKSQEVEQMCLKLLAMEQPVANDLRFIESSIKISSHLKRISKLSIDIARIASDLKVDEIPEKPLESMNKMAAETGSMLKRSIRSFLTRNSEEAAELEEDDDVVDDLFDEFLLTITKTMKENTDTIDVLVPFILTSRYLERIADRSESIGAKVLLMNKYETE